MRPIISVIIPNYNHSAFLPQRLESVFQQTFQDFEVILLDDASTDNSVEILRRYSNHSKVSHFQVNKINSGNAFKQWKKGISLAKGEFIWIAESDDFCELDFLEVLHSNIHPSSVLIYCASKVVSHNGEEFGIDQWAQKMDFQKWESDYQNDGAEEIKEYLRFRNTIPNASAVLFRKSALQYIDFPETMYYCGDWYIWLQIVAKGNISFINKPLNHFRKHYASTRTFKSYEKEKKRFKEYFWILRKTNNIIDRFFKAAKYDWILKELSIKEKYLGRWFFLKVRMPIPLIWRYLTKQKYNQ